VAKEERDADVAREERVATAAHRRALPLDLADRVPRELARPVEPKFLARPGVEDEEGGRVTGRAVAEAGSSRDRSGTPRQLAAGDRKLKVEQVAERRDHPGSSVAPLHSD